jgi:hypothetical protein
MFIPMWVLIGVPIAVVLIVVGGYSVLMISKF